MERKLGGEWHRRAPGGQAWYPCRNIRAIYRGDGLHECLGHRPLEELPVGVLPAASSPASGLEVPPCSEDAWSTAASCPATPEPPLSTSDQGHAAEPRSHRLLGVSLFDGCGAFWMLFEPFRGSHFSWSGRVSCETDGACRRVIGHRFPDRLDVPDVADFTPELVEYVLDKYPADAVILGAGSPCQQLSRAGQHWQGLRGADSCLFFQMVRVVQLFRHSCRRRSVPFFELLENVLPGDQKSVAIMTSELGGKRPLLVDAAFFGWTRRARLIWTNLPLPKSLQQFVVEDPSGLFSRLVIPHEQRSLPQLTSIFKEFLP